MYVQKCISSSSSHIIQHVWFFTARASIRTTTEARHHWFQRPIAVRLPRRNRLYARSTAAIDQQWCLHLPVYQKHPSESEGLCLPAKLGWHVCLYYFPWQHKHPSAVHSRWREQARHPQQGQGSLVADCTGSACTGASSEQVHSSGRVLVIHDPLHHCRACSGVGKPSHWPKVFTHACRREVLGEWPWACPALHRAAGVFDHQRLIH